MSRRKPSTAERPASASRIAMALALGVAATAGIAFVAQAQERLPLRGGIATQDAGTDLQATGTIGTGAIYVPISPGALPDEDAAATDTPQQQALMRRARTAAPTTSTTAAANEPPTTGTTRQTTIDALDPGRNTAAEALAERAPRIDGRPLVRDEDPFAPTGVRLGSFILRPSLQQGVEYTTNAAGVAGGRSDVLSETTLRLDARSDWSRHSVELDAFGTYRRSLQGTGFSEFLGGADARTRIEIGNDFLFNGAAGYQRRPEDATSAIDLPVGAGRPIRQTLSGSAGLEKALGPLRVGLTGRAVRNTYGDAPLAGGGSLSQADRNQTLYSVALRTGYQISPALRPFVEGEYGRRLYDNRLDTAGYARSANRFAARAGTEIDLSEKFNGELSAGVITERFDDTRLAAISALALDGSLNWSPLRGTTVSLSGTTEIEGSTTAGSSGSVLYAANLGVTHALRSNVTGSATLGLALRNYAGSADRETTWSGQLGVEWLLSRHFSLNGRLRHERVSSTIGARGSQATSAFMGVTLRR